MMTFPINMEIKVMFQSLPTSHHHYTTSSMISPSPRLQFRRRFAVQPRFQILPAGRRVGHGLGGEARAFYQVFTRKNGGFTRENGEKNDMTCHLLMSRWDEVGMSSTSRIVILVPQFQTIKMTDVYVDVYI